LKGGTKDRERNKTNEEEKKEKRWQKGRRHCVDFRCKVRSLQSRKRA